LLTNPATTSENRTSAHRVLKRLFKPNMMWALLDFLTLRCKYKDIKLVGASVTCPKRDIS
jgi:hypothetical protein